MNKVLHPNIDERQASGKKARADASPADHSGWAPAADRPDPVALLEEQNATREADLVPVRHGRMLVSPFTFYRGAAKIMAADLKDTPPSRTQRTAVWGCSPLELRGVRFARTQADVRPQRLRRDPSRPLRVRRQADGRELHHRRRNNGFSKQETRDVTRASVRAYREAMVGLPQMRTMDIWYAHLSEQDLWARIDAVTCSHEVQSGQEALRPGGKAGPEERPSRREPATACRRSRNWPSIVDGNYRIISLPPIVVPLRDIGRHVRHLRRADGAGDP